MKPFFSDEERAKTVKNYLIACSNKRAKIINYKDITFCLNTKRVKTLCKLTPSGQDYDNFGKVGNAYYINEDAKEYYEWLVAVVSGTEREGITEDIIKKANDQLFHFIQIMQNSGTVEIDKNIQVVEPYDWQKLFLSFDKRLTDMQKAIDKGDKDIIEVLKLLLQYVKENKTLMKKLLEDSETLFGK